MRIARFAFGGEVKYGVVDPAGPNGAQSGTAAGVARPADDTLEVAELAGHPFGSADTIRFTGARYPVADVRLLAPVLPSKVVAIGKNYAAHAREMGGEPPDEPMIFLKPSTAIAGTMDPIVRPVQLSKRVDYEGELAVVIGRLCKNVPQDRAADAIFGYTCANDVTARDLQSRDGQWARAKGFDTFCPLGPWIETELDADDLEISTTVNGEVRQRSRTSLLLHGVAALVSYVSAVMTLLPGDVLLTGTPDGVGPLEAGDQVAVSVEGIGTLSNRVVDED
ncbi:MAG TPA: fumarylacetoacetate hydrolase family protein [Streptosporangiaceae bacterium]|nr:fumarylacetoacetate hydrolase family protein [Streptosporangiaceae bacterium]